MVVKEPPLSRENSNLTSRTSGSSLQRIAFVSFGSSISPPLGAIKVRPTLLAMVNTPLSPLTRPSTVVTRTLYVAASAWAAAMVQSKLPSFGVVAAMVATTSVPLSSCTLTLALSVPSLLQVMVCARPRCQMVPAAGWVTVMIPGTMAKLPVLPVTRLSSAVILME